MRLKAMEKRNLMYSITSNHSKLEVKQATSTCKNMRRSSSSKRSFKKIVKR